MYGFWGSILVIGIINNVINWYFSHSRNQGQPDVESSTHSQYLVPSIIDKSQEWVTKYLIVPFTFGNYHQRLIYGCKLPIRIVSIVIVMYWSLSLILCAVNIDTYMGNL